MKKNLYYILMADVKGSRNEDSENLMQEFKALITDVSKNKRNSFLSPLTITLGDEFQSVLKSLNDAIDVIIDIEEAKIRLKINLTLRYVLHHGEIDTPINKKVAHEMYGAGLTEAREILSHLKKEDFRIIFELNNKKSEIFNGLFFLYSSIYDKWEKSDFEIINSFIHLKDYYEVAKQIKKNRGQIWRKEKSLQIPQYLTIRKLIKEIAK